MFDFGILMFEDLMDEFLQHRRSKWVTVGIVALYLFAGLLFVGGLGVAWLVYTAANGHVPLASTSFALIIVGLAVSLIVSYFLISWIKPVRRYFRQQ